MGLGVSLDHAQARTSETLVPLLVRCSAGALLSKRGAPASASIVLRRALAAISVAIICFVRAGGAILCIFQGDCTSGGGIVDCTPNLPVSDSAAVTNAAVS